MPEEWYYRGGLKTIGPLSLDELQELANRGIITPRTSVRSGVNGKWINAAGIESLRFPTGQVLRRPDPRPLTEIELPPPTQESDSALVARWIAFLRPYSVPIAAVTVMVVVAAMFVAALYVATSPVDVAQAPDQKPDAPHEAPRPPDASDQGKATTPAPAIPEQPKEKTNPDEAGTTESPPTKDTDSQVPKPEPTLPASKPAEDAQFNLADFVAEIERGVVRINQDRGLGSGFLIDDKGTIATNVHVVANTFDITVTFPDESSSDDVGYLKLDHDKDIALLRIRDFQRISKGKKPLRLTAQLPRKGDDVVVFGSPKGLSFSVSTGIVSAVRSRRERLGFDEDVTWVQITSPVSPGNSGGPIVNRQGEVVAMVEGGIIDAQNLNFGISSLDLYEVIQASGETVRELPGRSPSNLLPFFPLRRGRASHR